MQALQHRLGRTIENFTNFLNHQESARLCRLAERAHASEPSTEQNGEDDILNVAGPHAVISAIMSYIHIL